MDTLHKLLGLLDNSGPFIKTLEHVRQALAAGVPARIRLGNLYGSTRNLVAAALAEKLGKSLIYVTRGSRQAEKIEADLLNFLPVDKVRSFPQWEILPYEDARPEAGIAGNRMEVFTALMDRVPGITVATVRSLMQKVSAPENFCGHVRTLRIGETLDLDSLLSDLVAMGFRREAMVEEVGSFSLRGGILDIYGFGMDNPVRIELFGDKIEDIRSFEIADQRSVAKLKEAVLLPVAESVGWDRRPGGDEELTDILAYLDDDSLVLYDDYEAVMEEEIGRAHV